jgi:hypothetical protein
VDKVLKNHIRVTHGVSQRTLQDWLRAGVVPGVRRTKKGRGHYRVPSPPGMTLELYGNAVRLFGESARVTGAAAVRRFGLEGAHYNTPHLVAASGLPEAWWNWQKAVAKNAAKYRLARRQLRRWLRRVDARVPPFTLREYDDLVRSASRKTTASAMTSSSARPSSRVAVSGASAPAQ